MYIYMGKKLYRYQNPQICKISDFGSKSGFSILGKMVPTKIWTTQNRNHNFLSRFWAFQIVFHHQKKSGKKVMCCKKSFAILKF